MLSISGCWLSISPKFEFDMGPIGIVKRNLMKSGLGEVGFAQSPSHTLTTADCRNNPELLALRKG
jgi:hypothetical protein